MNSGVPDGNEDRDVTVSMAMLDTNTYYRPFT